jgi:glycosyltransferase 2 family protein
VSAKRSQLGQLVRLGVCLALLGAIFHAIFCNEAQLDLLAEGRPGAWDAMTRWEQRRYAWTHSPAELLETARRLKPTNLAVATGLCGLLIFLGGLRWREALRVQGLELPLSEVTRISFVAHFFNAFLLGSTGGDVWKAYAAARATHHKKAEAAVSVFVDRLIGMLALLLFAVAFAAPNWGLFARFRRYDGVGLAILGMTLAALGFTIVGLYTDLLAPGSRLARSLGRWPRVEPVLRALAACRLFGRHPGFMRRVTCLSLAINVAIVGTFVSIASGMGLQIPPMAMWFIVPAVVCLAALPVTPSGLGVRENLFVVLLAIEFPGFGVKPSEALSLSLLGYTLNLAWSAVGGLVYLTVRKYIPPEPVDSAGT